MNKPTKIHRSRSFFGGGATYFYPLFYWFWGEGGGRGGWGWGEGGGGGAGEEGSG